MALIDDVDGIDVKILVNGLPAAEYPDKERLQEPGVDNDEYDATIPRTFHYVESQDDAPFAIQVAATRDAVGGWLQHPDRSRRPRALRFHCDIDGHLGVVRGVTDSTQLYDIVSGIKTYDDQHKHKRGFRFATVSTVEDAGKKKVAADTKRIRGLGTIRVRVYRSTYKDYDRPATHRTASALGDGSGMSFSEKALKGRALSHGSTLSQATTHAQSKTSRAYYNTDGDLAPVAIFYFKYRSKDALRQEMIIPRSRSASMVSDVDKLPEEEVRRLAREYLAEKRGNKKRSASVKVEPGQVPLSERPLKILKTEGGKKTTIDLTEDD